MATKKHENGTSMKQGTHLQVHEAPASRAPDATSAEPELSDRRPLLKEAFAVGAALNRVGFFLKQLWFMPGIRSLRENTESAVKALRRAARAIVPPRRRDDFQTSVTKPLTELVVQIKSEEHADFMLEHDARLIDGSWNDNKQALREQLLKPVEGVLREVRRQIKDTLNCERSTVALRLGELTDEGTCSPEPHCFLDDEHVDPSSPPCFGKRRSAEPYCLATKVLESGEIPPEAGWLEDLQSLWDEAQLQGPFPTCGVALAREGSPAEKRRLGEELAEVTNTALQNALEAPAIRIEARSPAVRVGGQRIIFRNPAAFKLFAAVVKPMVKWYAHQKFRVLRGRGLTKR